MNVEMSTEILLYGLNGLEAPQAIQQFDISVAFIVVIVIISAKLFLPEYPISSQFDM